MEGSESVWVRDEHTGPPSEYLCEYKFWNRAVSTAEILFGVIGLPRCCGARDRQGDIFLRFKLGSVNGLGIKVERGRYAE